VDRIAENLITHLETRGAKAVPSFNSHLQPEADALASARVVDLTTAKIEKFMAERVAANPSPSSG
jgi:hypothetical protein